MERGREKGLPPGSHEAGDELRRLGRNPDLVGAALSRLEAQELVGNERFQRSLEQMRRGERGSWPRDF